MGRSWQPFLLKIGIHLRESIKSINYKIKLQILNGSPGISDGKMNCTYIFYLRV